METTEKIKPMKKVSLNNFHLFPGFPLLIFQRKSFLTCSQILSGNDKQNREELHQWDRTCLTMERRTRLEVVRERTWT